MRGNPQAASLRLRAAAPGRRWPAWLEQAQESRRRTRLERAEVIMRLEAGRALRPAIGRVHPQAAPVAVSVSRALP